MGSVPNEPHKNILDYVDFNGRRRHGESARSIAKRWGFEHPEMLYHELRRLGFPVCGSCGDYSGGGHNCKRRPKGGPPTSGKLPPPRNAEIMLWEFTKELHRSVDDLYWREETYANGRFDSRENVEGGTSIYRDSVDEKTWERALKEHEENPEANTILEEHEGSEVLMKFNARSFFPVGGTWYPPEPLTTLIGAYLLAGGELPKLVDALHPNPASMAWESAEDRIDGKDGLRARARQVAALVRGGEPPRQGRRSEEITMLEQGAAWAIKGARAEGRGDEEILRALQERDPSLTLGEILRLGNLPVRAPDQE